MSWIWVGRVEVEAEVANILYYMARNDEDKVEHTGEGEITIVPDKPGQQYKMPKMLTFIEAEGIVMYNLRMMELSPYAVTYRFESSHKVGRV